MADGGPGGRQRIADRIQYEESQTVPPSFTSHWTKADVKGLLHAMQGRVCAYCGVIGNGLDVEHFRPKGAIEYEGDHSGYWWLAYECSNLFLSCGVCNRIRKKNRFPLRAGATRCTYSTRDALLTEGRILLDPVVDPVEEWLTIGPDDVTGRLIPNPILDHGERSRVQESIELFGLNLDPEVRSQRSRAYQAAAQAAKEERWDDLRLSAMRHRAHSLTARVILRRVAPEQIPTAKEEFEDLVNTLWKELRTLVDEIRRLRAVGKPIAPTDKKQLQVLAWALAVLRSSPPAGDPTIGDGYLIELLEREGPEIRAEIVALFRDLE